MCSIYQLQDFYRFSTIVFIDAYPDYYPVSYANAIEELKQCCHRCSGDLTLFNSVVLLMNEMQSINPEGLHCLFSIDRLSGLFVPASDSSSVS